MTERPYDTKEGIVAACATYEGLHTLAIEREKAFFRNEKLHDFVAMHGLILLTSSGDALLAAEEERSGAMLDTVMTLAEYQEAVAAAAPDDTPYMTWAGRFAPPHVQCEHCHTGWTLADLSDVDAESQHYRSEHIDLGSFAGDTLQQVSDFFNGRGDAWYVLRMEVRNERWEDEESDDTEFQDGWRNGSEESVPRIDMSYVIQPGDWGMADTCRFHHPRCVPEMTEAMAEQERESIAEGFRSLVMAAGFDDVRMERIAAPEHIMAIVREERPDMDAEQRASMAQEVMYLRFETRQGAFAIVLMAGPMLDLTDSGVTLAELAKAMGGDEEELQALPASMANLCPFSDDDLLMRLCMLLLKKKAASAN